MIASSIVIITEIINTTIEKLCDVLHPEYDRGIRKVKDVAAGAVLLASICAFLTGMIIFFPYVLKLVLNSFFLT